ncbi:MAG: alpha/beta fold hydrolase [Xanthomonadaceae bacterium]|nr:alpha/beta fold hydrolase [Xanthomonadaceae bacterium]
MSARACVVLVHGLWYGRPSMLPLARRLKQRGWECRLFGYSSVRRGPAENIVRLRDWLVELDRGPLHLVGHSLGGLMIAKLLVESHALLPPGRAVLLGSPLRGSSVARRMAGYRVLKPWIGKAIELLEPGLERLPPEHPVGAIAGTSSLGAGQLIAHLEKPHDGTVSVAETRAAGLAGHLQLPVSHTGLVLSRQVAEATDRFLRNARF